MGGRLISSNLTGGFNPAFAPTPVTDCIILTPKNNEAITLPLIDARTSSYLIVNTDGTNITVKPSGNETIEHEHVYLLPAKGNHVMLKPQLGQLMWFIASND